MSEYCLQADELDISGESPIRRISGIKRTKHDMRKLFIRRGRPAI
jgi:hypothetical protein